jgi:hypothetical protein
MKDLLIGNERFELVVVSRKFIEKGQKKSRTKNRASGNTSIVLVRCGRDIISTNHLQTIQQKTVNAIGLQFH